MKMARLTKPHPELGTRPQLVREHVYLELKAGGYLDEPKADEPADEEVEVAAVKPKRTASRKYKRQTR